jgi:hypothetical protein
MVPSARIVRQADCFAIAAARRHGPTVLTGDPEILAQNAPCPVEDVRGT